MLFKHVAFGYGKRRIPNFPTSIFFFLLLGSAGLFVMVHHGLKHDGQHGLHRMCMSRLRAEINLREVVRTWYVRGQKEKRAGYPVRFTSSS